MANAKILVVDDETEVAEIIKSFLSRKGYAVSTADTAESALKTAAAERPDLVLLDVRLGDCSGLDVLSSLKKMYPEVKVVMLTGLADDENINKSKELGACDFITKPITASGLSDLVAKALSA